MWLKGHNRGTGFLLTLRPYILQCSWELFKVIFAGPHQLEQAQSGVSRRSPQAVSGQELQALADKRYSRQIAESLFRSRRFLSCLPRTSPVVLLKVAVASDEIFVFQVYGQPVRWKRRRIAFLLVPIMLNYRY
jgi:hypothetical protein